MPAGYQPIRSAKDGDEEDVDRSQQTLVAWAYPAVWELSNGIGPFSSTLLARLLLTRRTLLPHKANPYFVLKGQTLICIISWEAKDLLCPSQRD